MRVGFPISSSSVIEGVVIGVMVGVLLSAQQEITKVRHKKEQIRYVRHMVSVAYADIRGMTALQNDEIRISSELLQFDRLVRFIEDLKQAADYRMSAIDYKDYHEFRSSLYEINKLARGFKEAGMQDRVPMSVYKDVFGEMKQLSWLGLTDKHLELLETEEGESGP